MKNVADRIPRRTECEDLLANIVDHSFQVMNVALAITDKLREGVSINRVVVIAGALLHDIIKTRSLQTKEKHAASGCHAGIAALPRPLSFRAQAKNFKVSMYLSKKISAFAITPGPPKKIARFDTV